MKNRVFMIILTVLFFGVWITETTAKPPHHHHRSRRNGKHPPHYLDNLPEAEKARFQKLYKENPAAFYEAIRAYWKSEFDKHMKELMDIAKRHNEAPDAAAKQQIEQELRSKISQGFDKQMEFAEKNIKNYEKRVQQMQKSLEHLKKKTATKKQNKQAEIDKTVRWFLQRAASTEKNKNSQP